MSLAGLEDTIIPIWKIFGGEPAWNGGYPFQVTITKNGGHICGGAIINAMFILTAAHCLYDKRGRVPDSNLTVRAGEYDRSRDEGTEQERSVASTHPHEEYVDGIFTDFDIALIRLSTPFTFTDNVYAIPFHKTAHTWTGLATISGWGELEEKSGPTVILQKVDIPIVNGSTCQSYYARARPPATINNHICAGGNGKDACRGDSGGPLSGYEVGTYERVVVGLASFGTVCQKGAKAPGVYTNVSKYGIWIINFLKQYVSTALNRCRPSEVWCGTEGRCIPNVWLGGVEDCTNGTSCPANKFHCVEENRCINLGWKCDGDRDCLNGSDEVGCPKTCPNGLFRCNSGNCIKETWRCDGDRDCPTGDDEIGCPTTCTNGEFKCNSGKCIKQSWRCDMERDCPSGEDEAGCELLYNLI